MKTGKISVIGAGAWGTALANHITGLGNSVILWAYEKEVTDNININHQNSLYLKDIQLNPALSATSDIARACVNRVIFFVVPSHVMETIIKTMIPHLQPGTLIVSCTKGVENKKLRLPSQVFAELLPKELDIKKVTFSGPSFAREVASGLPTALTASSTDPALASAVQKIMSGNNMRVYTNDDPIGTELGGVLKNVVAIAAGISDGLEFGNNARSAIITRGLEESIRLGTAMGANEKTFRGLTGIGDLVLTCSGDLSRNRTVGLRLGRGEKLDDIVAGMRMVAEGVKTSESVHRLSQKLGVDMPICHEIYQVCHEGKNPRTAVEELLGRSLRPEFDG